MNKALKDLIRISNLTGRDSTLVQGAGGNTSVKTEDGKYMYIKASGTALKDMNEYNGWRRLKLNSVLSIMTDESTARLDTYVRQTQVVNRLLLACDDKITCNVLPSVESLLHALLDRCVIHLHPAVVLAYACAKNGRAELEKLFKDYKPPPLWVPYANPGLTLAKKTSKLTDGYQKRFGRKPAILFLQKHGLVISVNGPDAALGLLRKVINRCAAKLKQPKPGKIKPVSQKVIADIKLQIQRAIFEATGRIFMINYFYDDAIAAFWRQKNAQKMLLPGALIPDELLYVNGPPMWIKDCDSKKIGGTLNSKIRKGRRPPVAFLVKDVGLFVAGTEKIATIVRDIVKSSFFIRTNASRLGGILSLNKAEQNFINRWKAKALIN